MHQVEKHIVPAKDIFKWLVAPALCKGANLQVNLKGTFFLCVNVKYPAATPVVFCSPPHRVVQ